MSTKEGYTQVLSGGADGTTEGGSSLSGEALLMDQGLSGLKSFSEAGSDDDFINEDDFAIIEYFADYDMLQLKEDIENTPDRVHQHYNAVLKGLDTITDEVVVKFLLVVLYNLVEAISSSMNETSNAVVREGNLNKLMALLDSPKLEDVDMASKILAHLSIIPNSMPTNTIDAFMTWMQREMISKGVKLTQALQALMIVLRDNSSRDAFQKRGGVAILARLCDPKCGEIQRLYEVCFCLWVLSYNETAVEEFGPAKIIEKLSEIVESNFREKLTRVAIALLVNVVSKQNGEYCQTMTECNLLDTLMTLMEKHWSDPDVVSDMEQLKEAIQKNYRVLSSFERYKKEVLRGEIKWGPVHSEKFFRDNAESIADDDFKLVNKLIDILRQAVATSPSIAAENDNEESKGKSDNSNNNSRNDDSNSTKNMIQNLSTLSMESVAVACYDLGEFMRFYPAGKRILIGLGAKTLIMALMSHENLNVQQQALACCSKLMVSNWDQIVNSKGK